MKMSSSVEVPTQFRVGAGCPPREVGRCHLCEMPDPKHSLEYGCGCILPICCECAHGRGAPHGNINYRLG